MEKSFLGCINCQGRKEILLISVTHYTVHLPTHFISYTTFFRFIYSFNKYLLNAYTRPSAGTSKKTSLCPQEDHMLGEQDKLKLKY